MSMINCKAAHAHATAWAKGINENYRVQTGRAPVHSNVSAGVRYLSRIYWGDAFIGTLETHSDGRTTWSAWETGNEWIEQWDDEMEVPDNA